MTSYLDQSKDLILLLEYSDSLISVRILLTLPMEGYMLMHILGVQIQKASITRFPSKNVVKNSLPSQSKTFMTIKTRGDSFRSIKTLIVMQSIRKSSSASARRIY